jgi:hypothetical protein
VIIEPERRHYRSAENRSEQKPRNYGRPSAIKDQPGQGIARATALGSGQQESAREQENQSVARVAEHQAEHRQVSNGDEACGVDRPVTRNTEIGDQGFEWCQGLGIFYLHRRFAAVRRSLPHRQPLDMTTPRAGLSYALLDPAPVCRRDPPRQEGYAVRPDEGRSHFHGEFRRPQGGPHVRELSPPGCEKTIEFQGLILELGFYALSTGIYLFQCLASSASGRNLFLPFIPAVTGKQGPHSAFVPLHSDDHQG